MNRLLIFLFLLPYINYSQQFSFSELLQMFNDKSIYEKKNITVGNDITRSRTYDTYGAVTTKGYVGSFSEDPRMGDNEDYNKSEFLRSLTFHNTQQSHFVEDYEKESETGYTFYELLIRGQVKNIIGGMKGMREEMRKLTVFYARESDYLSIVSQVNRLCKYIGIEKRTTGSDTYISKYSYNDLIIKLDKEEQGGEIKIMLGNFRY